MVGHIFPSLLLLCSLSHYFYPTGGTYFAPKQSLSNQNLSSVPPDLDVRLRRLDLSNNFIRQLHALALPDLEQLDLSSNRLELISGGAFEMLARLEHLDLSRNRLNVHLGSNGRALGSLSRLRSLDISENGLRDDEAELLLQNKSSLDRLKMSGNSLVKLSRRLFRDSKRLRAVTIDDNLISEIAEGTFEPLSHLETLNLAKNNLAHICDFKLRQVKYLNLSRNSVEFFVTREDDQFYNLEILDLSHNKLLYFPIVPKLNRLKYLHLQNNVLGSSNVEAAMVSDTNALYDEILNWRTPRKNHLHANWRLMPLVYIDLSFNSFTSFPLETLSLLPNLETLHFGYNCLQSIKWNVRNSNESGYVRQLFFHSLKHLSLQSNGLAHISPFFLKALTQVEMLNLADNSVQPCAHGGNFSSPPSRRRHSLASCAQLGQMKTLKRLSLRGNGIKTLPLSAFQGTSLTSLDLARNPRMVMHERALEGVRATLRSLTVSEADMSSSRLSLPCMPALTELNVSDNNLDRLPGGLACSPLGVIDIRNNTFATLNPSLIRTFSANLTTVFLSGNLFNCCDSRWMAVLNEMSVTLPDIAETECFTRVGNLTMTEYLKSPSFQCSLRTKAESVHFGQTVTTILFTCVLLTGAVVLSRKVCGARGSFTV
ncbi:transforming growth factor beta activator LRRC32-like isoform X2 [Kryptolebias marmoratus]|uniref:Leucine-rich repeat-containing protein 32-like n=1 Tax=Kryptolebias marmoratus TaxID=37003 RepID=A0A3Q3BMD0_KRYMA|nr:transforming growth factor beta activator LRRC32-like isoform X2 [Kryptolebias marmoratus]